MPGPPLQKTFTYNGTPDVGPNVDPFNTMSRDVIQSFRHWNNQFNAVYTLTPERHNIPNNSGIGLGVGGSGITNTESYQNIME